MLRERQTATAARALLTIRMVTPRAGLLQFRLSSERFVRDTRFRVIFLFPADPPTMSACAHWAAQLKQG
jgi:hypothetical protein